MSEAEIKIEIARQFSQEPYGRWPEHGNDNGERFRQEYLVPALKKYDKVSVEMGGAVGYGSSFLEESFGGLVRLGYFTRAHLLTHLNVHHPLQTNEERVWNYINNAEFERDIKKRETAEKHYPLPKL